MALCKGIYKYIPTLVIGVLRANDNSSVTKQCHTEGNYTYSDFIQ